MLASPLFAAGVLTMMLAVYLVLDGIFELVAGLHVRPNPGWGWLVTGGAVSLLLGMMIWRQYPLSGPWAIGLLLGIKLLFIGMMMITVGTTVRSFAKAAADA